MIERHIIDRILDCTDIVKVIEERLQLKKQGVRYFTCCPFHSEDTPSFVVFPNTGTFKCFGCGEHGDVISFLMRYDNLTYPEAIKELAKRCDIEIKEHEPSAEEQMKYRTKEAMWAANERLTKLYEEELQKSKEAKAYAYGRWGEEYCKLVGVGFCPKNAKLVDKAGISAELEKSLHVKNKAGYDFFSGRITIPIRDRRQRIIGFTAREFNSGSNAKYMNSQDSVIYKKSESVFGIDLAWKKAMEKDTLYLVEGAPDCMKLHTLGVLNTLAPLGTAWTKEQFTLMKRMARHLCFIPDADPPKSNGEPGPGITEVMKSGRVAMKEGFTVSVKQIPVGEKKQDPDSYFKTRQDFNLLEEQDFILWFADLKYHEGMTTEQLGKFVNNIAILLTYINDETTVNVYITKLTKYNVSKTLWKKAVEKQRNKLAEEEAIAKAEKESDLYRQFGFNVEKNKVGKEMYYYSITEQGSMFVWSNFVMRPLFHIKDATNAKRIYRMRNIFGREELIELRQEDLVSMQKFMVRIESLGNFIWKATQRELNKLKQYLYEKTETAMEITQLGWQRDGFFAFGNGIYHNGKFMKVDEHGIVRLENENYYLPANSKIYINDTKLFQFERRFVHLGLSSVPLRTFTEQIFKVYGDNGRIGFMFYLATLFRDIVFRKTHCFPILNLFGPKGSGKTQLAHTLMSFFIIDNVPPNLQNSTLPALNESVAQVANALVHIDEYKNDMENNRIEFLKGIWDGTGRTRMNMDSDKKKKETTPVDSGVILSGQEMPTADIALFSRLIYLTFSKSDFTQEEQREYNILLNMRLQGMTHLTLQLLDNRAKVEKGFEQMYNQTKSDINEALEGMSVEERVLDNWLIPLSILRCLENAIDTSLSYKRMFKVCLDGLKFQSTQCKQNNELAAFWKMVDYLISEGELIEMGDYRIEYIQRLKTDEVDTNWLKPRAVLFLQRTRVFYLYKKHSKLLGDGLLPEGSLKHYLRNSKEFLGEKVVKYKMYHRGIVQMTSEKGMVKEAGTTQRSFCFDYDKLSKNYSINLLKTTFYESSNEDEDEKEESPMQRRLDFQ